MKLFNVHLRYGSLHAQVITIATNPTRATALALGPKAAALREKVNVQCVLVCDVADDTEEQIVLRGAMAS